MANRLPLTDDAGEVLPPSLLRKNGLAAPEKEDVTLSLSREVVERFRATGNGWQARMDEALKEWLGSHSL